MFWLMKDYFVLLKNFEKLVKKKVIEIVNVMIDEGYEDGCVILIVISKVKEWVENVFKEEIDDFF